MKTATITFHGSHNYGSVLQAYALQKTIIKICGNNEIINFRTDKQIDLYNVFTKRKGLKYALKNASHFLYKKELCSKHARFECFINNMLKLTDEVYKDGVELERANFQYDCIIAGSDQIWNPIPSDFDWSYFVPFAKGTKKVAYAPSFGPFVSMGDGETSKKISKYLSDYYMLSVREEKAQKQVCGLIGKQPRLVLDPTFLLSYEEWNEITPEEKPADYDYIFLYTLFATKEIISIAKALAKKLKMPVIISNFTNQYDVFSSFEKHFDSGPLEFLSLVKNAKLIVATSFHGTVFSLMFNKPFYAINGDRDERIQTLLNSSGLTSRIINTDNIDEKCKTAFNIDFNDARKMIEQEKKQSIAFLQEALVGE